MRTSCGGGYITPRSLRRRMEMRGEYVPEKKDRKNRTPAIPLGIRLAHFMGSISGRKFFGGRSGKR